VEYSIPAVRLADGTYIMDSFPIVGALEMAYPTPSLHLDWEKLPYVMEKTLELSDITAAWWKAKVPRNLLLLRSAEYFSRERQKRYNMPLDQLEEEQGTEERWVEAKPVAEELGALLKASGGPYFKGSTRKFEFV
jgi:glutathione S-transferase